MRLPNDWPMPTFMHVDENDSSLSIEWCFGEGQDSWRVTYWWHPVEGAFVWFTTRFGQEEAKGGACAAFLDTWLRKAKDEEL